jgi:hypothetical protein
MSEATLTEPRPADTEPDQPTVRYNAETLKSSYCNVANAISSREEVVLNFGINKSWDRPGTVVEVDLEHRIVLTPNAARRLYELMGRLLADHHARYGSGT